MGKINIPRGKTIKIWRNETELLPHIPFVLEEDITITLKSSYEQLIGSKRKKLVDELGKLAGVFTDGRLGFSSQFKQLSLRTWSGTDPVSFKCTLKFGVGKAGLWSAREEVYNPVTELSKITLPSETTAGNLVAPGPSILTFADDTFEHSGSEKWDVNSYSILIGNLYYLPSIVIEITQPVWSTDTDEDDVPIKATVELDITTTTTATQEMITQSRRP